LGILQEYSLIGTRSSKEYHLINARSKAV
jgi:hypothetical protein